MGRRTKYDTHILPYFEKIRELLAIKTPEIKIAQTLGVSKNSFQIYRNQHPEFAELFTNPDRTEKLNELLDKTYEALWKTAHGFNYTEKETHTIKDADGNIIRLCETTTEKYQPPQINAIFGALNRYDKEYIKDRAYYELRKEEIEIKKKELQLHELKAEDL